MGIVYEIICWTTGLRYIGQTKKTLKVRLSEHISAFNTGTLTCSSELVFEHGNYEIYELEKVEDESILRELEKYYIQHTDCVNVKTGDFDRKSHMKEYRQTEKHKSYRNSFIMEYRQTEKNKSYAKEYAKSEKSKLYRQTDEYKEKHRQLQKAYIERKKLEKSRLLTNGNT